MSNQLNLFETPPKTSKLQETVKEPHKSLKRKYVSMDRCQVEFKMESLESMLPINHDARTVWKFVEQLDLSDAEQKICSLDAHAGRPAIHPRVLIALWIYGITQGIVSARKISEYCNDHRGFIWLTSGNQISHHVLSNFRSLHAKLFEDLVVQSIALLVDKGLVELKKVAQDGVKIKANASKSSFRRKKSQTEMKKDVKQHIRKLEDELKKGEFAIAEKRKKERELLEAQKNEKRIDEALKEMKNFKNQKNEIRSKYKKKKLSNTEVRDLRTSTTDPECRKMKMADASFQPAYNFQISTESKTELALGARVTQNGTDGGEMLRMYEHLESCYEKTIDSYVVDDGYMSHGNVEELYKKGTKVYMPTDGKMKVVRKKVLDGNTKGVSEGVEKLIKRMETKEGKEVYKERMRISETIHAYFRNHGLGQLPVRGATKVLGMVNLFCLAYNMTVIKRLFDII